MIKIHDIILFAISIFFMVILISNYISKTKLIEANDIEYINALAKEFERVEPKSDSLYSFSPIIPNGRVSSNSLIIPHGNKSVLNVNYIRTLIEDKRRVKVTEEDKEEKDKDENTDVNKGTYEETRKILDDIFNNPPLQTLCQSRCPKKDGSGGCNFSTCNVDPYFLEKYKADKPQADGSIRLDETKCYTDQNNCNRTPLHYTDGNEISDTVREDADNNQETAGYMQEETESLTKGITDAFFNSKKT